MREKSIIARGAFFLLAVLAGTSCVDGQSVPPGGGESAGEAAVLADSTLDRMLREIQPAVERTSGLSAASPLNVAVTDEARLRSYLEAQMGAQLSDEKAAALTSVYARLGLVPEDLDLKGLLKALLEEQVIGYYDPKSDTLFVHDRVPPDALAPVLAHELVHALQDQYVPLDSIVASFGERSDPVGAYQAAVEGHATFSMMEWQFAEMTGGEADLTTMPDMGPMLEGIDLTALGDFGSAEVLAGAPTIVREGLIFPYIGGLLFLQRSWTKLGDRPLPFRDDLPRSTEQILHVDRWIEGDSPTLVSFATDAEGLDVVRASDLGEFEIRVFLREFLDDRDRADAAAAGWDGDAYRLLSGVDGEVFVWVTVWDTPGDAEEFAAAARDAYGVRYRTEPGRRPTIEVGRDHEALQTDGRTLVTIVDAPPGVTVSPRLAEVELSGN